MMSKQIYQQIDNQTHQMNVTIGVEKTRELRRAYYAAVSFVDNELGRVISEVRMLVILMSSVVVMIVVVLMMMMFLLKINWQKNLGGENAGDDVADVSHDID